MRCVCLCVQYGVLMVCACVLRAAISDACGKEGRLSWGRNDVAHSAGAVCWVSKS
jgi:hypothetical protein